jgi:hypothetical protein
MLKKTTTCSRVKKIHSAGRTLHMSALGGKMHGSLKESTIVKLTRETIFSNIPDTGKIQTALCQYMRTDDNPQHHICLPGEMLWCFFNKTTAKGEKCKSLKQCAYFSKYESCNKANTCIPEARFR